MSERVFRLSPGVFVKFKLEQREGGFFGLFPWWSAVAFSDDPEDLINRVRMCGGRLEGKPVEPTT